MCVCARARVCVRPCLRVCVCVCVCVQATAAKSIPAGLLSITCPPAKYNATCSGKVRDLGSRPALLLTKGRQCDPKVLLTATMTTGSGGGGGMSD